MSLKIMEVVLTLNFISSENGKTFFFQTMTMDSFVIPLDLMRDKWESLHICKLEAFCSFMMAEVP